MWHPYQIQRLLLFLVVVLCIVVGVLHHGSVEDFVRKYQKLVQLEIHELALELVLLSETTFSI